MLKVIETLIKNSKLSQSPSDSEHLSDKVVNDRSILVTVSGARGGGWRPKPRKTY